MFVYVVIISLLRCRFGFTVFVCSLLFSVFVVGLFAVLVCALGVLHILRCVWLFLVGGIVWCGFGLVYLFGCSLVGCWIGWFVVFTLLGFWCCFDFYGGELGVLFCLCGCFVDWVVWVWCCLLFGWLCVLVCYWWYVYIVLVGFASVV